MKKNEIDVLREISRKLDQLIILLKLSNRNVLNQFKREVQRDRVSARILELADGTLTYSDLSKKVSEEMGVSEITVKKVTPGEKIAFSIVTGTVLCLLFPVASPLFVSFFLGVIIKEANISRFIDVSDNVILSGSTLFLGFTLGCLLSADIVMDPKMFKLILLGFIASFIFIILIIAPLAIAPGL